MPLALSECALAALMSKARLILRIKYEQRTQKYRQFTNCYLFDLLVKISPKDRHLTDTL
jgi:hypothetical protein